MKIVSIGDEFTGKTCLLIKLTQNTFPRDYVPTVFDNYAAQMSIPIKGKQMSFNLNLWDTAGQQEYDTLRPLSYSGTDTFLLFFSIDEPDSFENITAKWVEEVEAHKASCPGAKLFVMGPKQTWELMKEQLLISKQKDNILSRTKKAWSLPKRLARRNMWSVQQKQKIWKKSSLR